MANNCKGQKQCLQRFNQSLQRNQAWSGRRESNSRSQLGKQKALRMWIRQNPDRARRRESRDLGLRVRALIGHYTEFEVAGTPDYARRSDLLGQNDGRAARDHHRVLELCHKTAVARPKSPAIGIINHKVCRHRQKGFDRKHHSLGQDESLTIVEVRYRWSFVQPAADAVPVEISNGAKTVTTSAGLNYLANVTKPVAGSRSSHCIALGETSCFYEALSDLRHYTNRHAHARVREVSIKLCRNVDIYQVPFAEVAGEGWNAMSGFVVDAEARRSGEVVGHSRGRSRTIVSKYFASNRVEFSGGDAGPYRVHHCISSFCDHTADSHETFEIFVAIDRHGEILRHPRLAGQRLAADIGPESGVSARVRVLVGRGRSNPSPLQSERIARNGSSRSPRPNSPNCAILRWPPVRPEVDLGRSPRGAPVLPILCGQVRPEAATDRVRPSRGARTRRRSPSRPARTTLRARPRHPRRRVVEPLRRLCVPNRAES